MIHYLGTTRVTYTFSIHTLHIHFHVIKFNEFPNLVKLHFIKKKVGVANFSRLRLNSPGLNIKGSRLEKYARELCEFFDIEFEIGRVRLLESV